MKKPFSLAVFVSASFIGGTLAGFFLKPDFSFLIFWLGISFLFFIGFYFRAKRLDFSDIWFGIAGILFLFCLGSFNTFSHQPENDSHHYIHQEVEESSLLLVKVIEKLKSNIFSDNYIVEIQEFNERKVRGKALMSVQKDSISDFEIDDQFYTIANLTEIPSALNPHQFDYSAYMAKKKIYKQIRTSSDQLIKVAKEKRTLRGRAAKVRKQIKLDLVKNGFSADQISLMEALLLGQRTELSRETYSQFADAGVVHILAVSGLHVGILLYFLMFLLKPLLYLPKGRILRTVLLILFLWIYAYIAGMSPSILRAVTMFSFLSLGLIFKRRIFSINMLCLSALVLLMVNPNFILEIGFQLSYTAVLSILVFYKKIEQIFPRQNLFFRKAFGLISVTLAAQLGVLPLSLFYFHQFPGMFFISNLLIIPFLGIILGSGVMIMVLSHFFVLPELLVKIYGGVLDLLQLSVQWIAGKENLVFRHIYFSTTMFILSVFIIGLLALIFYKRNNVYKILLVISILFFVIIEFFENQHIAKSSYFYVFHQNQQTLLGFQQGKKLQLNSDKDIVETPFAVKGLQDAFGIKKIETSAPLQNYYHLEDYRMLVIDSLGIFQLPFKVDISDILLSGSPKVNLERILDSIQPSRVIADGSNYKSLVERWEQTCIKKEIPFYYTGAEGSFSLKFQ